MGRVNRSVAREQLDAMSKNGGKKSVHRYSYTTYLLLYTYYWSMMLHVFVHVEVHLGVAYV